VIRTSNAMRSDYTVFFVIKGKCAEYFENLYLDTFYTQVSSFGLFELIT